ncbi:hypothetical protein Csa_018509 [Cucumis sativus]|uniref:Uncharacterized protein n=1 Tax=Cucumis sativus TaxID=3659 RepID=A0A0A0KLH7_CUCSA|nr:hypothetical protein Csa_018509 [Cucumis sativus]
MSRLTTTYVLPLKDDVEKLKHPPTEYSFIDQDHSVEFVVSRLKEDFEKKSKDGKLKRKLNKYNHRTSQKGYANLVEEMGEFLYKEKKDVANVIDDVLDNQKIRNLSGGDDVPNPSIGWKRSLRNSSRCGEVCHKEKLFPYPDGIKIETK